MGKTLALEGAGLAFARGEFERYYRSTEIDAPRRFSRREFAAFPFASQNMMRRHAAFKTEAELRRFLAAESPRHVYYSSAYYRQPEHAQMAQKGWLGADLIFDLDADHLRHAEGLDYAGQLALVKQRFRTLLDDFLFGDFGIDPEQTTLVFSGGRGYHVHVYDPRYLELTSPERREIVEYILGVSVEPRSALAEERAQDSAGLEAGGGGRRHAGPRSFQRLVDPSSPGWPGRISRSVLELVNRWELEGREVAVSELEKAGMEHRLAVAIARQLLKEGKGRWIRERLTVEVFDRPKESEEFLRAVLARAAIEVQGETDAPVTTDIHRLIRLPGSRHGGTGLVVRPIGRDALDGFDPLRDAVAPDAGRPTVRVRAETAVHCPFGPGTLEAQAGEEVELGPSAALFLLLRGEATLTSEAPARSSPTAPPGRGS
jgi:DNA primase small subunit